MKELNKKQKKKNYKKEKKKKEKIYNEISGIDLDEFLKKVSGDFLSLIDEKNKESEDDFIKIRDSALSDKPQDAEKEVEKDTEEEEAPKNTIEEDLYAWLDNAVADDDWEIMSDESEKNEKGKKKKGKKDKEKKKEEVKEVNVVGTVSLKDAVKKVLEVDIDFSKIHSLLSDVAMYENC